jgi:hypothetical protein
VLIEKSFDMLCPFLCRMLMVLPHVIVGPAALVRVRILVVTVLAALAKVVLRVRDTVATAATTTSTTTIGTMLRMVGVAWALIVCVAVLVSLNVMTILL